MGCLFSKTPESLHAIFNFKPVYRISGIKEIDKKVREILYEVEEAEIAIKHFAHLYVEMTAETGAFILYYPSLESAIKMFLLLQLKADISLEIKSLTNLSLKPPFVDTVLAETAFGKHVARYIEFLTKFDKIDLFIKDHKKHRLEMKKQIHFIDPSNCEHILDG